MQPVLIVEASGLRPGEEANLLKMLESSIYNSKREPTPPARVEWQLRLLTDEEKAKLGST